MAHDFGAEDLEDGEQWLPSDFFSIDEVPISNKITSPLSFSSSSKPPCMEESFQLFAPSTLLNRSLHKPLPNLQQRFKPAGFYGSTGVSGGVGRDPCQLQRLNPVQSQVERSFVGERAWALQRQQRGRFIVNRVFPGLGMSHGGTGVFLPRVSSNRPTTTTTTTATVVKNNNHIHHCVRKGPRMMNTHEFQLPPRKILLSTRQEEFSGYAAAPAEVRVPNNCNC